MEERFAAGAANWFNVMAPLFPSGLEEFVTLVVPELRRRDLFREAYEGETLRENLGVSAPLRVMACYMRAEHPQSKRRHKATYCRSSGCFTRSLADARVTLRLITLA
jgi:hypothetical protein